MNRNGNERKRLSKDDYNKAKGILKRYNYNCLNIVIIPKEIYGVKAVVNDGQPKAPYSISDPVFNTAMQIEDNKLLQQSIKEYKIVQRTLALLNDKDINYIFEHEFRLNENKWKIINDLHITEATYKRRKMLLIYTIYNESLKAQ